MPQQQLLETTGQEGFALQVNGRSVVGSHEQLVAIIKSRLGQNHADFLATPAGQTLGSQTQASIRWSTRLAGDVKAANLLGSPERAKLESTAQRLSSDIRGLAAQMQTEGPATQLVGQMLERCIQVPSGISQSNWLFSVGGKPVTVLWGHSGTDAAVMPVASAMSAASTALSPAVTLQQAPMQVPTQADYIDVQARDINNEKSDKEKRPWLRWLVGLLLALLLLALLLFGLKHCAAGLTGASAPDAALAEAEQQNKLLDEEIAKKKSALTQYQCVPEVGAAAAASMTEDKRNVLGRGGQAGALEITLAWGSQNDIDLQVTCPSGAVIFAKNLSACGGTLDIDANGSGNRKVGDPVEHVVFADPMPGQYSVAVANCERFGLPAEPFRLTVEYQGRVTHQIKGVSNTTAKNPALFCGAFASVLNFSVQP